MTTVLLCSVNVILGWNVGYHALATYGLFWLSSACVLLTAMLVTWRVFPQSGLKDAVIRIGILSFGLIVGSGLVLGSIGWLTLGAYAVLQAVLLMWCLFLMPPPLWGVPREPPPVPPTVVGMSVALLVFVIGFGVTHSPLTLYDSLSYHLFFPASWLQDHRLSIIPSPFSDEAQSYQPGNGELFFLWLMLPFHGDLLARLGQLPFYLLGGVALYALARRIGAPPEHAVYAPAFFLLSRPIVEQAVGADVDLICAAMFLTSLYLGIIAVETNRRRDWMLWGISLGLYGGSKYLALVYTPVFLMLALMRGPRLNALWALPGVLALALPWYVRNWLVAGSPIYPASLSIAGLTIAHGAFTRSAMLNSVQHTTDLRLLPVIAAHAFGATLFMLWIPFASLGTSSMLTSSRRWPARFVAIAPVFILSLYWFGVPDNVDSRFLMPAVVTAMVPFAFAFRSNVRWNTVVHVVYALGMLWLLVGINADLPVALPWNMRGWLSLQGLVERRFLGLFLLFALVAAGTWSLARKTPHLMPAITAIAGIGCVFVSLGSEQWCVPSRCDILQTSSPYIRASFIFGWRWISEQTHDATIAYTGNNLPYPLLGDQLTNRVQYVNIDDHPDWRFHDYDRAERTGGRSPQPTAPLATSSDVLAPARPQDGPHNAARPRYARMYGDPQAWFHNLKQLRADYLFVSALSAYEIDDVWHNAGGFPIEDEWAKSNPQMFRVVYENSQVRIYAVDGHEVDRRR